MFAYELEHKRLVCPFDIEIVLGRYWLTSLKSKRPTAGMRIFRNRLATMLADF